MGRLRGLQNQPVTSTGYVCNGRCEGNPLSRPAMLTDTLRPAPPRARGRPVARGIGCSLLSVHRMAVFAGCWTERSTASRTKSWRWWREGGDDGARNNDDFGGDRGLHRNTRRSDGQRGWDHGAVDLVEHRSARHHSPLGPDTHMQSVSCPQANLCVAVDAGGNVLSSTNPTGGVATWKRSLVDPGTWLAAISCPTTSLCVAGDGDGNLVISANPTAGAATWSKVNVTPGVVIDAVSCPTTSFCVAGNRAGKVITSTDPTGGSGAWTAKGVVGPFAIVSVSCMSSDLAPPSTVSVRF